MLKISQEILNIVLMDNDIIITAEAPKLIGHSFQTLDVDDVDGETELDNEFRFIPEMEDTSRKCHQIL